MKKLHTVSPVRLMLVLMLVSRAGAETRFHHVHLLAHDPPAVAQYYCARFHCKTGAPLSETGFDTGRGFVLIAPATEIKPTRTAFWHLGWGATDIRAEYVRQLDLGTRFTHPLEYLYGSFFFAYVAAPHGVEVEINPSRTNEFSHIHLWSAHPALAGEWYVRFLGLKATRPLENKPVTIGRYTISSGAFLETGGVSFLIFPKPEDAPVLAASEGTAVDHLAFQVDNLDQKILDFRKSGARILAMPRQVRPNERAAFVQGPDRMKIELIEIRGPN